MNDHHSYNFSSLPDYHALFYQTANISQQKREKEPRCEPHPFQSLNQFNFTNHVHQRMSERGFTLQDIAFVLRYGRQVISNGIVFFSLCQGELPKHKRAQKQFARLKGCTVLVDQVRPIVITVYRRAV